MENQPLTGEWDKMTEDALKRAVIECAELFGWRVFSIRRSDRALVQGKTGKGFPDVLAVRREVLLAAELKSTRGRLTLEQLAWREALRASGVRTFLWRPSDWTSGAIEAELR